MISLLLGLLVILTGILMLINPLFIRTNYFENTKTIQDFSEFQPLFSFFLIFVGFLFFLDSIKNLSKKKNFPDMICPNCEDAYSGYESLKTCPKCDASMELLEGFYERGQANNETEKEK